MDSIETVSGVSVSLRGGSSPPGSPRATGSRSRAVLAWHKIDLGTMVNAKLIDARVRLNSSLSRHRLG